MKLDFQRLRAKGELVSIFDIGNADGISIDPGAIGAVQVVNTDAGAGALNPGMASGDIRRVEHDVIFGSTANAGCPGRNDEGATVLGTSKRSQ